MAVYTVRWIETCIRKVHSIVTEINFGEPAQIAMVQRAYALWVLLKDDPIYSFQARTVSLAKMQTDSAERVIALTRLQGYASCHFVPRDQAADLLSAYDSAGLNSVQWDQYWGRESAISASRAFLETYQNTDGLSLKTVNPDTPDAVIRSIGEMSMRAGVLPPPASGMRGIGIRGVYQYVETADGTIVASGGGFMSYHPDGPRPDEAFWGMLATDEHWRGKRLACWVGAQIVTDLATIYGARGFSSGVKANNPSSQAMCSRLGINQSDFVYAGATDPVIMGNTSVTR